MSFLAGVNPAVLVFVLNLFLTKELAIVFLCAMYNLGCGLSNYNVRWKFMHGICFTHAR